MQWERLSRVLLTLSPQNQSGRGKLQLVLLMPEIAPLGTPSQCKPSCQSASKDQVAYKLTHHHPRLSCHSHTLTQTAGPLPSPHGPVPPPPLFQREGFPQPETERENSPSLMTLISLIEGWRGPRGRSGEPKTGKWRVPTPFLGRRKSWELLTWLSLRDRALRLP